VRRHAQRLRRVRVRAAVHFPQPAQHILEKGTVSL
jgi:hypothetical protein